MNDRSRADFDLDELLHPAQAFGHPSEVVNDPDLSLNEKRAILAAWASDACAVEASPELAPIPAVRRFASTKSWKRCGRWTSRPTVIVTAAPPGGAVGVAVDRGRVAALRFNSIGVLH